MARSEDVFQAGLIFTDETDVVIDQFVAPIQQALRSYGEDLSLDPAIQFDRLTVAGDTMEVRLEIFDSPEADPGALRVLPTTRIDLLDPDCREAIEDPTFWLHLTVTRTGRFDGQHEDAPPALLAEIVHLLIAQTGAPYVQWLDRDVVLTSRRFQEAFTPITVDEDFAAAANPFHPQRDVAAAMASTPFPGIELTEIDARFAAIRSEVRQSRNTWVGTDPAGMSRKTDIERLRDVFRSTPAAPAQEHTLESRLATWTVNAAVAMLNPPVAATLFAYNAIKGEDFRVSTHALTLSAVGTMVGFSGSVASAMEMLPF